MTKPTHIIGERLVQRLDAMSMSQGDLADALGISQGAISLIATGMTKNSRYLPAIADQLCINLGWLAGKTDTMIEFFDDDGEPTTEERANRLRMISGFEAGKTDYQSEPPTLSPETMAAQLGSVMIPQLDIGYSMGGGSVFDDYQQTAMVPFPRDWLSPMIKGRFDQIFVARGEGDSMQPTLLDGDLVIVDTAQQAIMQQDRLWCLSYGDLGMIKRVRKLPDGGYQINSDNTAVSPISAYDGEMHVVGRVIWIGRRV